MPIERKQICFSLCGHTVAFKKYILNVLLTITINVNSTGITLSIVVSVGLISVGFKHTVVTAVANVVPVCIILGRIVYSWAVVLFSQRNKNLISKVGHE